MSMRADPDIVLLGEMSELETIKLALGCASMGMLDCELRKLKVEKPKR